MKKSKFLKNKLNIAICFLTCLILVLSLPFQSHASTAYRWNSPFNQPVVSEYGGYVVLVFEDSNFDSYQFEVYVWDFDNWGVSYDTVPVVDIVIGIGGLVITPYKSDSSNFTLYRLKNSQFQLLRTGNSGELYRTDYSQDRTCIGYQLFGHYGVVDTYGSYTWYTPSVVWMGQVENTKLVRILEDLLSNSYDTVTRLDWLYGSTMSIEQQVAELKAIQLQQLSWLERIFYKIEDLFDKDEDTTLTDVTDSKDKIHNSSKEEQDVMHSIVDREDTQEQMQSDIDDMKEQGAVDSNGTWSVFDAIVNSNPKILGMFITVLSIAVIGLIFNRG